MFSRGFLAAFLCSSLLNAGTADLYQAVEADDTQAAERLLQAGASAKAPNRYGATPLWLACTNGSPSMIALLLKAGADPNTALSDGETALMTAARTGNVDAVNVLLAHGAAVGGKEASRGQTALMWAAAEGHLAVVQRLLEADADVRARSTSGFTALVFATREGRIDIARALLKAGADVNETLPARIRRQTGATEFGTAPGGASPLDIAVTNRHFDLAAMLLDAGANPNLAVQGWTPLHTLTWVRKPGTGSNDPAPPGSGNMDSVAFLKKLVSAGADVNARMTKRSTAGLHTLNASGATPFLMAARTGDTELMRALVELGADPLLPNNDKTTPLMAAAGVGTRSPGEDAGSPVEALEAVKLALELGNDINAVDANGETAMHGAAYKHLPNVAQFLAGKGARVDVWNQKNKMGWTPLQIAEGVQRTGNFRSSAPTASVLRSLLAGRD